MKKTQIILLTLFAGLIYFNSSAQNKKFSFNEVYQVSSDPELTINTNDGDINVFPSDKNEIEVFYIVERNNDVLKISRKELEDEFIIDISAGKNFLTISVKQRYQYRMKDWRDRLNVSFDVYTPIKTACDLQSSDGDIRLRGLTADQKLQTSDGDVEVRNVTGDVYTRTSDGDIVINKVLGEVEAITSDGDLELRNINGNIAGRTSDGDVELEDVKGRVDIVTSDGDINASGVVGDMKLGSSDGDLRLVQSKGETVLATSDGDITFRNLSGSLKAKTSDGEIRGNMVELASSLELRTSDGNIVVTVPDALGLNLVLRGETIRTALDNFSGTAKDHLVEGRVNGGGKLVDLHASGGSVSLSYD